MATMAMRSLWRLRTLTRHALQPSVRSIASVGRQQAPLLTPRLCAGAGTRRHFSDEVAKAQAAASQADSSSPTIFDKIISKEIPASIVHEDDECLAFRDVAPQAPVHILVIPKKRDGLTQLRHGRTDQATVLGHLLLVASKIGAAECPDGFRVVINDGEQGCQSVFHLHLHVIGGRQLGWPPG
eukprot:TRINITY_DN51488_c0_g1_i1.p1 TRINITY_DN51488_c0_g1~~TRINITY_DN51488_c0_g1_i1.p1  ORF type:complete len:208 (-),score=22.68 TRINITY_DN51488_c0_g1_i1:242-790(-)